MEVNDTLRQLIENRNEYSPSSEDFKKIHHEGLDTFIFNKLNSSKFRASAIEESYRIRVLDKIRLSIAHKVPIQISLPFGATKNPYLPTAPGIDWAEVFNLALLREYLAPIAATYSQGVVLNYISVAVFEEKVNRIPKQDTDVYDKQFQELLDNFGKYLPKGLNIKFLRVEDAIPREKIEAQLEIKMKELKKSWKKQPQSVIDYKLLRAKRNSLWGEEDKDIEEKILKSALGHDAFCSECWTLDSAPWDKKDMITLGHTYTKGWAIHIRSAKGSTVNFWSGIGALICNNNHLDPTVLSPIQFKDNSNNIKKTEVEIFFTTLPHLKYIPVIE